MTRRSTGLDYSSVGLVGIVSALLGGRLTDTLGPRAARLIILGGHAVALAAITILGSMASSLWAFGIGVGVWAVFAWALNPPMQASIIAAAPQAAMTAVSLNTSSLYLGAAVAGAPGGLVVDRWGASMISVVGTVILLGPWLVAAPKVSAQPHETDAQWS